MSERPHRVHVVVDPSYGERLTKLPPEDPVWVVESADNSPVARRLSSERPTVADFGGLTTFSGYTDATPEQNLLAQLGTIDLHHGHYSARPPYSVVLVIGASPTPDLQEELSRLGFRIATETPDGFVSVRTASEAP